MYRRTKLELRPTATQAAYLSRCAGTMRFTYNQLVAKFKTGDKYNRKAYQKHCTTLRQATPWMQEVSARATYEAAENFHKAVTAFFKSCKGERKGKRVKPPTFKKKGKSLEVFQLSHISQFSVQGRNLTVTGLQGEKIRMREFIRLPGTVKAVSISLHTGKWFASFLVEVEETPPAKTITAQKPSVGIDFGLKVLAALSTGEVVENPKPLQKKLRLLRRRQRQADKKRVRGKPPSNRCRKASGRVSRLHKKVADQRAAAHHAFTSSVVKRFGRIVIEDLAVSNMLKNRRLARSISDAGWATLRQQLEYKCKASGVDLVIADRFLASSKTCSCCGHKLENLTLSVRTFKCPACLHTQDRDTNAAVNLNNYEPSPPIRGRSKTGALDLCKTPSGAGSLQEGRQHQPLTEGLRGATVIY